MKRRMVAALLLSLLVLGGCAEKDVYAEWEEDWAMSEQVSEQTGEEEQSEVLPPDELQNSNMTSYSALDYGYITPYELKQNENDYPRVDWAYSAFKVMEANLIKKGEASKDTLDLSEGHFLYYAIRYADKVQEGTNEDVVYIESTYGLKPTDVYYKSFGVRFLPLMLTDSITAVSENDVPFKEGNKAEIEESFLALMEADAQGTIKKDMGDWFLTDYSWLDVKDRDLIKNTILEKGAVQLGYDFSDKYISPEGAYYSPYTTQNVSHTAAVIGWDDNYSKTNFLESHQPKNDGAWLVYDTAGSGFGMDGYFWVSYEDTTIQEMVSFEVTSRAKYGEILSYDQLGLNDTIKLADEEYTSIANVYKVEENQEVHSVGIYTLAPGQEVEINVYTNVSDGNPSSGVLASTMIAAPELSGYHVVELEDTVPVVAGESFSVVLKYTNGEECGEAPIEGPWVSFNYNILMTVFYTAQKGQSFAFCNGEWHDLADEATIEVLGKRNMLNNACIKVLMKK